MHKWMIERRVPERIVPDSYSCWAESMGSAFEGQNSSHDFSPRLPRTSLGGADSRLIKTCSCPDTEQEYLIDLQNLVPLEVSCYRMDASLK